jgi:hypothetical protein
MILYTGVVENRIDPARLGRCQVRVVGLHTENKKDLPTELLPWAYPMQPVTSAAMNGIGYTPLGPVEGTWVIVFFRDEEKQQPIMMGTIGGIPQNTEISTNYLNDGDDYLIKTDGQVETGSSTPQQQTEGGSNSTTPTQEDQQQVAEQTIGVLTDGDIEKYKIAVARLETTSEPGGSLEFGTKGVLGAQNYGAVNAQGRIGKYQMTGPALNSLGYVGRTLNANGETEPPSNQKLADNTIWQGKSGLKSVTEFLGNAEIQEKIMEEWTRFNYNELKRYALIDDKTDKKIILGYLHASHPDGVSRSRALKSGQDVQDGYGNTTTELYKNGYASLEGDPPKTLPQNVPAGVDANTVPIGEKNPDGTVSNGGPGVPQFGFKDPFSKYPIKELLNEPDTNRLARHEQVSKTIVGLKDSTRTTKVPVAITKATWNQPESPYNAIYPYNHVYQSESGHVQEWDDTPNNERIHTYHTKGTFTEVDANGTQVNRIVGDGYYVVDRNGYLYIKGAYNLTVDGSTNVFFRSDANIEVTGDAKIYAKNNVDMRVSGKMDLSVLEDLNIRCKNFNLETVESANVNTTTTLNLLSKEDTNIVSKQNLFLTTTQNTNIKAKGNLFLTSNLSTNFKVKSILNITADKNINMRSEDDMNIACFSILNIRGSAVATRANQRFDISSGTNVNIVGSGRIGLNSGGLGALPPQSITTASEATDATEVDVTDLEEAEARETPVNSKFEHLALPPRGASAATQFEAPEDGDPTAFVEGKRQRGDMPPTDQNPKEVEGSPKPQGIPPEGKAVSCEAFKDMTEFPLNTKLSDNFYLGDFVPGGGKGYINGASLPHKLQDQAGLTKAQIICNLKALAQNTMEAIIKIVPKSDIIITSGYRQLGLLRVESASSQHPRGMACDIVLRKSATDRKKHHDLIQEIAAKVPHDQLILEYQDPNVVWIHVSYNGQGNQRKQDFTMNNHKTYAGTYPNGGHKLIV